MEELLVTLSWTSGRGTAQTRMLFELCGRDLEKLLKLEAYQKRKFLYACPDTKEEVDEQVKAWDKLRETD